VYGDAQVGPQVCIGLIQNTCYINWFEAITLITGFLFLKKRILYKGLNEPIYRAYMCYLCVQAQNPCNRLVQQEFQPAQVYLTTK